MSSFRIELDEKGRVVLIDDDTGQKTIYATQLEAEQAARHLTEQQAKQQQKLEPDTVNDPDKIRP